MANFLSTTIETTQKTLNGGESGLITQTGGLYVDGSDAIRTNTGENVLSNDGYIYSFNGTGSAIEARGERLQLFNGQNGFISAEGALFGVIDILVSTGAEITNLGTIHAPNHEAIEFVSSDSAAFLELQNFGFITAENAVAVFADVEASYTIIQNSGTISSIDRAISLEASTTNGNFHIIKNDGVIVSTGNEAILTATGEFSILSVDNTGLINGFVGGVVVTQAGSARVTNSGVIATTSATTSAIDLTAGADLLSNSGTVQGAVFLRDGNDDLINSGTIHGDVSTGDDADEVTNSGTINGSIAAGDGEDKIVNSGTINGEVGLGLDDDLFKNAGTGFVSDKINGDAGNDTIRGGSFDDTIDGGGDDDLLRGKNGDDDLTGGTGNDTLFGGNDNDVLTGDDGDDELRGGNGDDTLLGGGNKDLLIGGNGDDTMEGGAGNDTLRGGAGDDTIAGQNGSDQMSGGAGADVFLFTSTGHSAVGNRDDILDFEKGQDKIDIDGLSNDTFVFLGNGAFTASGDAEVRVTSNGAGNSVVRIDTDGDGLADSEIDVLGVTGLEAGDFIL